MQADKADHSTTVDILQSLWGIYVYSTWMSNVFQRFAQSSLHSRLSFINYYGCEQNNVVVCEAEINGQVNEISIIQRWIPVFVCLMSIERLWSRCGRRCNRVSNFKYHTDFFLILHHNLGYNWHGKVTSGSMMANDSWMKCYNWFYYSKTIIVKCCFNFNCIQSLLSVNPCGI